MKTIIKAFGIGMAYTIGVVAGMKAAPVLIEKVSGFTHKLTKKD